MWNRPCTKVMPAVVHPTKCNVTHQCCEYIVPEIHPSHTTNVTHHHYKHIHSFPHTTSQQQQITHQHFVSPTGMGPGAPTQVSPFAGPGMGPGMGPGAGPGFGPTQTAPFGGPGMGPGQNPWGMGPMGNPHHKKPCGR
ncbi:spore coat protein [Alkalihalobacterium alkalinitrilicum]|uniref:spore coat protein n=1 Tax=Alkalihalobacterium alkalinitrilicum TaxID=427920 RepID=UPI000994F16B|nr:spore coat protein [Alkalihalobacterium alkalinitrilicum]